MDSSPIERLLEALDRLDLDAATDLMTPNCRLRTADGRSAEGIDAARRVLADLLATLRSTTHRVTAQWQEDAVWIAEVDAAYVLQDWLEITDRKRAFFVSEGSGGITDVRVYGAHERPLSEHRTGEEGMRIGGRWVPPL